MQFIATQFIAGNPAIRRMDARVGRVSSFVGVLPKSKTVDLVSSKPRQYRFARFSYSVTAAREKNRIQKSGTDAEPQRFVPRKLALRLKIHVHTADHAIRPVVTPASLSKVSEIGTNCWSPLDGDPGIDQRTVMTEGGTMHGKDASGS